MAYWVPLDSIPVEAYSTVAHIGDHFFFRLKFSSQMLVTKYDLLNFLNKQRIFTVKIHVESSSVV